MAPRHLLFLYLTGGSDPVPELAKRKADNLLARMEEVNEAKKLVRKMPAQKQVAGWIQQAAGLPRLMRH